MTWSAQFLKNVLFVALLCCGIAATLSIDTPAYAATDILSDACQTAPDSDACKDRVGSADSSPLTGVNGVIFRVARIVASVAGIIAIIMIIVSGFKYMTSGGDSQKAAESRRVIIGAVIGLVIIVLAQTIITFVVRRL